MTLRNPRSGLTKPECTRVRMEFQGLGRRKVIVSFDGNHIRSDGGRLFDWGSE